jgi:hypothetical protein
MLHSRMPLIRRKERKEHKDISSKHIPPKKHSAFFASFAATRLSALFAFSAANKQNPLCALCVLCGKQTKPSLRQNNPVSPVTSLAFRV